jgi:protein arginine kinase
VDFFRERQWLPERPVAFPGTRDYKLLFLGNDPADHALVGEVEHWTQIRTRHGLDPLPDSPPPGLAAAGLFAHSPTYGFLTSHPSHCGAGLQIECGVHLPALTALRSVSQVQKALNATGFDFQALMLRVPGSAEAGFYRIATRGGMEFSEEKFHLAFLAAMRRVLDEELKAAEIWMEREKQRLEDRLFRSLRLLQEARTLAHWEFLVFSSFARVGAYLGLFPGDLPRRLEDLRIRTQPGHAFALLKTQVQPQEADIFRANMVRSGLKGIGPPE